MSDDARVHVAMVVPLFPPTYGGAGLQAERLARALGARGVRVTVLTTRGVGARIAARGSAPFGSVRRFRSPARRRGIDAVLGSRAAIWLATHRFDLLHLHTVGYFAVLPTWVARARRRPYLLKTSLLGGDDLAHVGRGRLGALLVSVYREAGAVVAVSDAIERTLREGPRLRGSIARVPNGVDTALFRPADAGERARLRAALGIDACAFLLVTAGQLGARKGVAGLVRAAGRIEGRPLVLALAGPEDRDAAPELERALADAPSHLHVRQPGHLPPDELVAWLRAADAFALNSSAEGLPNALLEAAACGLACVATDIAGSRELLAGGSGVLVPAGDGDALARALDQVVRDAALRAALGQRARARAVEGYSLEQVADSYLALYRSLLEETPAP
jgi:glycosyltransferase involved in cell wall biosynthesis